MSIKSPIAIAVVAAALTTTASPALAGHPRHAKSAYSQKMAAQKTWTTENLDRLASAYSALNPNWTRP